MAGRRRARHDGRAGAALAAVHRAVGHLLRCCATHSGPIFHTVSYAIACGLPPLARGHDLQRRRAWRAWAAACCSAWPATGSAPSGRWSSGCWSRRWRAGAYFFTRQLGEFYAVAVVFGMAYGGVMPLYAVIAREYFPMRIMGTVFGAAAMVSSLGMALGPGGRRLDLRHTSAATAGSISARSPSASARPRSRCSFRRCPRARARSHSRREACAEHHSFTGVRTGAPLAFSSTTTNLAGSVALALRPTT